jgi:hypothetical protein
VIVLGAISIAFGLVLISAGIEAARYDEPFSGGVLFLSGAVFVLGGLKAFT